MKVLKLSIIISLILFTLVSCTKEEADKKLDITGTYTGSVDYQGGQGDIANTKGSLTIVKSGDVYNINFSDNIPSIEGVYLNKGTNVLFPGWDGGSSIVITENSIELAMSKAGESWAADCRK